MEISYARYCENMDDIEKLRLNLYKHSDSIIQNKISEEILSMSEELDIFIIKYYKSIQVIQK